jgi:hypothetical protein
MEAAMRTLSPERKQLLDVLADGRNYTPADVAAVLGKTPNLVNKLLLKMEKQGLVYQPSYGLYALSLTSPIADYQDEPERKETNPGVYVLKSGPYYKIGKSMNIGKRVNQLIVALPQETVHVHSISTDNPGELERQLHEKYAAKRVRGEWFELDMFEVDELCDTEPQYHIS